MSLATAIVARWNAKSLNSTIANLYSGEEEGAPPTTDLPRASFEVEDEQRLMQDESVADKIMVAPFTFTVYAASQDLADTYGDAIENAFDNSHAAASSPFGLPAYASVQHVTCGGRSVRKEVQGVYRLDMRFDCQYSKAQVVAA